MGCSRFHALAIVAAIGLLASACGGARSPSGPLTQPVSSPSVPAQASPSPSPEPPRSGEPPTSPPRHVYSPMPKPPPTNPPPSEPGIPGSLLGTQWYALPTNENVVALTFDAGANADAVPSILQTLSAKGVPATFFLTGKWVEAYPGY